MRFSIILTLAISWVRAQTPEVVAGLRMSDPALFADGRPAASTRLSFPYELQIGPDGLVYIGGAGAVRRIGADGRLTTVLTDQQLETFAQFGIDSSGTVYYDTGIGIRKAGTGGSPVNLAGYTTFPNLEDGSPALGRNMLIAGMALAPDATVYFSEFYTRSVWRLDNAGVAHRLTGPSPQSDSPGRLGFDRTGRLHVLYGAGLVRIEADGSTTLLPLQVQPGAFAFHPNGTLYVAGQIDMKVYRVNPDYSATRVAGSGNYGFSNGCGSGSAPGAGDALTARIGQITSLAFDGSGNLLLVDQQASSVRMVTPSGQISTLAGIPPGFSGDGGPVMAARFAGPRGIAFDSAGNLFIADTGNNRVRKVSADGIVRTVAGDGSPTADLEYDCSTQSDTFLRGPQSIAVDSSGNLYIADTGKQRVVRVAPDGTFTWFAGTGAAGTAQAVPGMMANTLPLDTPVAVGVDAAGNVYLGDSQVRTLKIAPDGTVADVIPGVRAQGFGRGTNGDLYLIANWFGYRVTADDKLIPVAGSGQASSISPNGPPPLDEPVVGNFPHHAGLAADANGTMYSIVDGGTLEYMFPSGRIASDYGGERLPGGGTFVPQIGGADLATSPAGAVHIVDSWDNVVWRLPMLADVAGAGPTPRLAAAAVRNAGSHQIAVLDELLPTGGFSTGPYRFMQSDTIAPGELIQITGESLGPANGVDASAAADGTLPTSLGGVQVSLSGTPLQLQSVQEGRVIAVTPPELPPNASYKLMVSYGGGSDSTMLRTSAAAPGQFLTLDLDGGSTVVAEDLSGAVVTQANPVARGSVAALYGTGLGAVGADGRYVQPVVVTVNGVPATVQYAGTVPGFPGLAQVNILVPDTATGPVDLTVGGVHRPQGGRLWIK